MRVCADIDIAATGNGGQRQDEGFFVKRHRRAEGDAERALLAYALVLERLYDGLRTEPPRPASLERGAGSVWLAHPDTPAP